MKTKIEWATDVWNPVTGCTKVSEGCRHCYAETIAKRFWGERKFTDVRCHWGSKLDEPLHWKKPRRIFVNSMSDLFHRDVPFNFVENVFEKMTLCPQHTFMILTKRADRMAKFFQERWFDNPLPNVWLGVTVENQKAADERIPLLLKTPAAVRFVSVEPMLEAIRLDHLEPELGLRSDSLRGLQWRAYIPYYYSDHIAGALGSLDWVICGGETGPGARPMHPDWARSLRDQCQSAGVPFFFKSWGDWWPAEKGRLYNVEKTRVVTWTDGQDMLKIGKKLAGRLLDGREWNEIPEVKK